MVAFWNSYLATGTFWVQRGILPAFALFGFLKSFEIVLKELLRGNTVLKALEMSLQFRRTVGGKTVDNPSTVTPAFDHSVLAKVGEMLGNPRLADLQNFLKMAHAERPPSQEIDDPEASRVAKALVDLNQFHVGIYS